MSDPEITPDVMRVSWGPQHPMSGQTRILIDIDGEKVHKLTADLGFTHRGIEKILENRTFLQGIIPVERMVMVDTANVGLSYVLAIEEALEVETPDRADWIRSMICELCRINSHLYAFGLQVESTGYFPAVFLWTTIDREIILDLLEELSGLVPPDLDIGLEELSIDRQTVRMRVQAKSFQAADRLGLQLAKFGPFASARIGAIEKDPKTGSKRFNVTISLKEPEAGDRG